MRTNLRLLIATLKGENPDKVLKLGFLSPHSYLGHYEQLAFEPTKNVRVGNMLTAAEEALGSTYIGYDGGEYTMSECTEVWIAEYGHCGDMLGTLLLGYMLNDEAETRWVPKEEIELLPIEIGILKTEGFYSAIRSLRNRYRECGLQVDLGIARDVVKDYIKEHGIVLEYIHLNHSQI